MKRCGAYLGDNDATSPQLTCIRDAGHSGRCDNTSAEPDLVALPSTIGETSDGYHTFNELYAHRTALFLALCAEVDARTPNGVVWKSKLHSDGSSFDGWFIMGIGTGHGQQITYHLPMSAWADAGFAEVRKRAPEFDGHTPTDVVKRLGRFFR